MLETVWFLLWGILWAIYFMLDGFDLGLATVTPLVAKGEQDKKVIHGSVGPFWDGNEVWLITAGGVTFAAFPAAYATLFSALYTPLMIILFALIVRAVSLEFRNKQEQGWWRSLWDKLNVLSSVIPAILFGVAFANIFRGIPIDGDGVYQGSLLTLLNPYGLAGGLFFLLLFTVHGALWLATRAEGGLRHRAGRTALKIWPALVVVAVLFLVLTALNTGLYHNYLVMPVLFIIPGITVLALLAAGVMMFTEAWGKAWILSAVVIVTATLFGVVGLYPNLLPSTLNPAYSLTVFNSASSPLTLKLMLAVALVFVPVVIAYQAWTYRLFLKKAP